ncbi:hypothetical protein MG296_14520 [Flavobacteriaceae bacterium TK19130]|nr:hypothetical protein [Thermobacterium salinum]
MDLKLIWKKKFFSNHYRIFEHGHQIGELINKPFSNTTKAKLNGEEYIFKTTGFFNRNTEIIDSSGNVVGKIDYGSLMRKATISTKESVNSLKFDNSWNTKWSIQNKNRTEIKYAGSSTKGEIESKVDDSILLLSGLFITNYYWQTMVAVMIAIMIPIMANS